METQADLLWLVPALPLAGFAVNTLAGRHLRAAAGWLATLLLAASFAVTVAAVLDLVTLPAESRRIIARGPEWFAVGDLSVAFDLRLDPLSAVMALVVTGVGTLIHLYSIGYMAHDERRGTYFAWLNLFAGAMLVLVLAQNFPVMFLGWEGVGLCSYLLIGFWSQQRDVPPAAKKAFITNRIGDVGFLLAMFLIYRYFGSLDFDRVLGEDVVPLAAGTGVVTAIALLLFLACTGKSAQIPLYVWLPDAMVGPTPVSALIHAATMVTAGVFLVARVGPLFEASGVALTVVVVVGAVTALLAAVIAIGQDDIKRVLAYSTVSQLGYMFIGVGLGPAGYAAGIFHLVTHAFFKAQLFLGAGSVMHANDGDTDLTRFGGLRRVMPLTFLTTMAAWLAIIGFPLTSGFFSKEQVLSAALASGGVGTFAYAVGLVTAGITAFYMSRLVFLTFFGERRWPDGRHPHESPPVMTLPLAVLGVLALAGGALGTSHASGVLQRFLAPALGEAELHPPLPELVLAAFPVLAMLAGVVPAWVLYGSGRVDFLAVRARLGLAWRLLARKLYVDEVYELVTVKLGRLVTGALDVVDRRVIDGLVDGAAWLVSAGAERGRRLQSGLVRTYAVGVLGGAVLIIAALIAQTALTD